MSRCNFTILCKHLLQLVVVGALRQSLDKDVQEAALTTLALLASLMGEHLDLLAVEFELLGLSDGGGSGLLGLELDVAEATALTVWVELKFAGANGSNRGKGLEELLLRDALVNVAHEHISLWLHEVSFLEVATDEVCSDLGVVQFSGTTTRLFYGKELEEAVAILALGLLVHIDDRLIDVETKLLHVLV